MEIPLIKNTKMIASYIYEIYISEKKNDFSTWKGSRGSNE